MPRYYYNGRNAAGEAVQGHVDAADRTSATRLISALGHMPISIHDQEHTLTNTKTAKKRVQFEWGFHRRVKLRLPDLLLFSRELADLVASGMKLGRALHTLAERKEARQKIEIISALRDEIIQGSSLSTALERFPESFSSLYINLVRAGEASGNLPDALENICQHYERVHQARSKVSEALIYPTVVLIFGGLAVIGMMVFIVPKFTTTFEDMGATLPAPTVALMQFSQFMVQYGPAALAVLLAGWLMLKRWITTPAGKKGWHGYQLKLPFMGPIIHASSRAHFSRTLSTLLRNGVSVLPALKIVQLTVENVVIADEIHRARARVTDGSSISKPLSESPHFPSLMINMLAVGEETGDISSALKHITHRYDHELDRRIKTCTTLLEPLLIVTVAIIVGGIAISLLLPILTLTDSLHM
jgi:type II secretory pathway component PulF